MDYFFSLEYNPQLFTDYFLLLKYIPLNLGEYIL
jgi:hypothetical protein